VVDELVAGISAIEERHVSRADAWQESLGMLPLRTVDAFYTAGDGEPPENMIRCGNQAMWVVTFTFILENALRIELSAHRAEATDLLGCGQRVDRTIKGVNGHSMPQIRIGTRLEAVRQAHGLARDITENSPRQLLSSSRDFTAVGYFGVRPESTTLCALEELARLDVHPLALSVGVKGDNEDDQLGKGEFAVPSKVVCRLSGRRIDILGGSGLKRINNRGGLAWFPKV
jgi:hypothetical protein